MNRTAAVLLWLLAACPALVGAESAQTIHFDPIPNQILGISPFPVEAQASSGLPVSLASTTPAVCRIASTLVIPRSAGTCSITASQSGNASFNPAPQVTRSFTVSQAKPSGTLTASSGSPFATGTKPQVVAVGDFNGDGIPDLAMPNASSNNVTVLLGNGSGGFTPAAGSPFAVGSAPFGAAVADFNGDGFADIATANGNNNTVTVLLGNGSGGFTPATGSPFSVGNEPIGITAGDFNDDGIPDLAVSNFQDSTVTVLLGNGSGGFTAASGSPISVGTSPGPVAVGDFNGDGIQDLAVASYGNNTVTVLLGNGSGRFTAATGSPFPAGTGSIVTVVGDFNGDGNQDLAITNYSAGNVTVLLGNGSGGFTAAAGSPFTVGSNPFALAAADFDGDGITDLAVPNSGGSTVTVLIGNGSGGFTAAAGGTFAVGTNPNGVAAADFNGDGLMDLAAANAGANSVTVLLGAQVATSSVLSTTSALVIPAGQTVPLTLTVSDSTTNFDAPTGTAAFSDGATVLGTAAQTTSPYTFTTAALALGTHTLTARYGGDARTAASGSNTITIQVEAAQTITFAPLSNVNYGVPPFALTATASSGLAVSFASTTPAACSVSGSTVTVVSGGTCSITASQAGNAVYAPAAPVTQAFSVFNAPQTIHFDAISNQFLGVSPFVIDAQASSALAVSLASTTPAVCTSASLLVTVLGTGTCSITASQSGNANFTAAAPVSKSFTVSRTKPASGFTGAASSPFATGSAPEGVAVADFNGDGIPDFATTNSGSNNVSVFLGNGSGGFTAAPGSPFAVGTSPFPIAAGDFNGDGIPDLAVANYGGKNVTILLGNGSGGFTATAASPIAAGSEPAGITVSDFNADGIQDLAVANFGDSTVTVLLGNGSGGFTPATGSPVATGTNPSSLASGDFNGDGNPDLAIANYGSNNITVLLGNGSGGFTAAAGSPFSAGNEPSWIVVGDFNGDGKPDIATANYGSSNATVLLGNGSGGFTAAASSPFATGSSTYSLVVGDFNGDGFEDLAVTNAGASNVTLLLGNGSGGFTAASTSPYPVGSAPIQIAAADFNGDGLLDLVTANESSSNATVLLGVGTTAQTITFAPLSAVEFGAAPFSLTATASSGLTVTFASTTAGICTVAGTQVTLVASGTCSIAASQGGNSTYASATPVTENFIVLAPPPPPPVLPTPLSISSAKVAEIALGGSVSGTFTASGGSPPYKWSATSLPNGLTLNAQTGALSGTPPAAGNFTFTLKVTDSAAASATQSVTVEVLGITTASPLPAAVVGTAYSESFTATGGSGTDTFSLTGSLPGLGFSGALLTGTPTSAGTFKFQVQATDGNVTVSASFTLTIAASLSISSSGNPGEIAFGSYVAGALKATGGQPPYAWSAAGLPAGVTLNAASGALGGSPLAPGNYSFSVQVADSENPPATKSITVTLQVLGLTTPAVLPAASTTAPYAQTFTAAGGAAPYSFSSQSLPAGLSFSGALLSGTPSTVGVYNFSVRVTDGNGFSTASAFNLTVTGPPGPLSLGGGALAGGTAGTPYSQALTGTGGAPPYTWSFIGGTLPPGLSLNGSSGVISGVPLNPGAWAFTLQAVDSSGATLAAVFSLTIAPQPLTLSGISFPNGIAGANYPLQIPSGSGGVAPYTFAITNGSLPPGLTFANGQISGIPTTSGTFSFSITMSDAETPPLTTTAQAQIVIAPSTTPGLILSTGSLSFTLAEGAGGLPGPGIVTVQSSAVQQQLNYTAVVTPAVSWLDLAAGATTPGSISAGLDPSAMSIGASSVPLAAQIVVTCVAPSPCAGQSQNVAVSLMVTAPPPQLAFTNNVVSFSTSESSTAPISQQVTIQNIGGGAAIISSVSAADSWLTVTGAPASVPAGPAAQMTFTASPSGLGRGFYRTSVTIESSGGTLTIPVTLQIAQSGALTLSAPGAQFQLTAGSTPLNNIGSFEVGTTGNVPVNWTASVQSGASWLQLNQNTTSGLATSSGPGTISFSVNPAGLTAAQTYYGTIQVSAVGVINSPLNYLVVLNVLPTTTQPVPVLQPAGLVFETAAGGSAPPSQNVAVFSTSGSAVSYSASTSAAWLSVSPGTGSSSSSASEAISSVSVNPGTLPAGIYTGSVSYQFPAAVRSVNVTMIVEPGSSAALRIPHAACSATQIAATQTALMNSFVQAAFWPVTVSVITVNNCGAPAANAQVVATFSNGDPALTLNLTDATHGLYSATWIPNAVSGQMSVTATVTAPNLASAAATVSGQVVPNSAPTLNPGGTLNVFNPLPGGPVGQGAILQIYGSNLSSSTSQATSLPLPSTLGTTSVIIGGYAAPLFYTSPGQINAQLPRELTAGMTYPVIVNNSGALSFPNWIQVAAATPGIAAFPSGEIIAQHADYSLVSDSSPAVPGEYLVIYLSGMGLTSNAIADGAATPASPFSIPLATPTLTLNGVNIPIYFSGLTPGDAGLYQINFQVPGNTPNGDLPLVVSEAGQSSNAAILPVHN
ncbi:MAG TPA: FG-GAP-like repeat-containing protein [Bryobacteraceae bacterium]|nr:FG-GAP-like repeat-containing protein [Bryobacteraceae bacterium]